LLKQLLRLVDAICLFCFLNVVISYVFDCWVLIAYMRAVGMVKQLQHSERYWKLFSNLVLGYIVQAPIA
jgi:hypothetical protein